MTKREIDALCSMLADREQSALGVANARIEELCFAGDRAATMADAKTQEWLTRADFLANLRIKLQLAQPDAGAEVYRHHAIGAGIPCGDCGDAATTAAYDSPEPDCTPARFLCCACVESRKW